MALRHTGDAIARSVAVRFEIDDREETALERDEVPPGSRMDLRPRALSVPDTPGWYPLVVRLAYSDENGHPFSNAIVSLLPVGSAEPTRMILPPIDLEVADGSTAVGTVRVLSTANVPMDLRVRVVGPKEIRARAPARVRIAPGSTVEVPVEVESVDALPGSLHDVYLVLEGEDSGTHRAAVGKISVRFLSFQDAATRWRGPLLGVMAVCILLIVRPILRRAPVREGSGGRWAEGLAVLASCGASCGVVLWILQPDLLLHPTIPSGGDMTSHVGSLEILLRNLLPRGRVVGWTQGNLGGYPLFQMYFPFPFLVMAGLSGVLPTTVAFKIGSVAAAVLFPASMALALRRMDAPSPVPAAGALLSLVVLLNEHQMVWGGNLLSLMAGEIAYSYGFFFFPLFLAETYRAARAGRVGAIPILLEVAMGLSHGYALLYGGVASLVLVFAAPTPAKGVRVLCATHGIAFLVLGAWIVPLLAYLPYGTAFNFIWVLDRKDDLLPPALTLLGFLALVPLAGALRDRIRGRRVDPRILLATATALLALGIYRVGYRLHVVDIRFLPFWHLGLALLASLAFLPTARVARAGWVLPIAIAATLGFILPDGVRSAPGWARWNYSGLEARSGWATMSAIRDRLRGSLDQPRVFYEHSPDHNALGTVRIFESLPLLARRQTLEGIYIQSSPLSPFIYYIQSELSDVTSAALPDYHYAHVSVETGLRHLGQFNARQLLIRSPAMRRRLDRDSGVRRVMEIGSYTVYERVGGDSGFAVPIRSRPMRYAGENPKHFAYAHFLRHPDGEPIVALPYGAAPPTDWPACVEKDLPLATVPYSPTTGDTTPPVVSCELGEEEVRIRTNRPGWPIRLAMSFHPRWRAEGARIYAATPGFFLVVPEGEEVVLRFATTGVEWTGMICSLAGLLLVGLPGLPGLRRAGSGLLDRAPAIPRLDRSLDAGGAALLLGLAILPLVGSGRSAREWHARGEEALGEDDPAEAIRCFDRILDGGSSRTPSQRVRALRWRGIAFENANAPDSAAEDYRALVEEFPESEWAPEAAFHVATYYRDRGDTEATRAWFAACARMDPEGRFGRSARDLGR